MSSNQPAGHGEQSESKWPGVEFAYELAMGSYDLIGQRLDAANARIQALLGFVATTTLAAPVIVRSIQSDASFDSLWFIAAIGLAISTLCTGIVAIQFGSLVAFSPTILYEKWLEWPDWEFKKNAIFWAGRHFETNSQLLDRKFWATTALMTMYFAETGSLLIWGLSET